MISLSLAALLFAQAGGLPPVEQDRVRLCLDKARTDPPSAISDASIWLAESAGAQTSLPQQCLGTAYTSLLRWQAAEDAFVAARDARPASDLALRARLGGMAGNAALAEGRPARSLTLFAQAETDASSAGQNEIAGEISADRARAYVALGKEEDAAAALAEARELAPQSANVWLLSATLARRTERLEDAQTFIQTAAQLAPQEPSIGLEAGLIAALSGREDAARTSWRSVLRIAPDTPESATARAYLAQLDGPPPVR